VTLLACCCADCLLLCCCCLQTRQRRAPSTLHDYQVENPAAGPAGAAVGSKDEQQRLGKACLAAGDDDGDASFSEGYEQEHGQPVQQPQRGRSQGRSRQQVPNRVIYRGAPYQEQQQFRQQHPLQQQWNQWPSQPQQQQHLQQQQQDAIAGAVNAANFSPELMSQLYQMGAAMGQALQQQGGGAPGANVSQVVQMCARMFGGDPGALVQHLMAQQVADAHAALPQQ